MSSRHTPAARARLQEHRDLVAAQARDRASDVAELLARPDLSRRQVAARLGVSKRTVERHAAKEVVTVTGFASPLRRSGSLGWMDRKACRTEDAGLFFGPEDEHTAAYQERVTAAKAVCARCPVTAQCLDYAFEAEIWFGVAGGLDEQERRAFVRGVAA